MTQEFQCTWSDRRLSVRGDRVLVSVASMYSVKPSVEVAALSHRTPTAREGEGERQRACRARRSTAIREGQKTHEGRDARKREDPGRETQ